MNKLTFSLIQKAYKNHLQWFPKTPIEYTETLSHALGVPFFFKYDFLQPMGSYHIRGAYFMLSGLLDAEKNQTICIAPENELIALSFAYVAELLSIACIIYLKEDSESALIEKIKEHKVEIVVSKKGESHLKKALFDAEKMGYIHLNLQKSPILEAGDGGSLALEVLSQIPQLKNLILPVAEETLCRGMIYLIKRKHPECRFYGCLDKKEEKQLLCSDFLNEFEDLIYVSEKQREQSLVWLLKNHQMIVTPKAASTISACLSKKLPRLNGVSGTILTERSLPYERLQKLVS